MGKWSKYERRYSADWEKESNFKDWIQKVATYSTELSCVFALIWAIFGYFLWPLSASFGEQFGYKIFVHLATLAYCNYCRFYDVDNNLIM